MSSPYVSIGLPVFNGERFIGRAVDTLLEQDFENFELLISDNASTDQTEEICRDYLRNDKRVRYERHERNRGASYNFNRLLVLADPAAKYVKWAAADDEHRPQYLGRVVELLDDDSSAALAHTGSADIDEEGYVLKVWHQSIDGLQSDDPADRLRELVTLHHECFGAFGLIRQEVAQSSRGLDAYSDADNVLLARIALRGRFVHDPDVLFLRRQHADRSMAAFAHARRRAVWFDTDKADTLAFPTWRVGKEFMLAIQEAPLSSAERNDCYQAMSTFVRRNWQNLAKNVIRSAVEGPGYVARRSRRARVMQLPAMGAGADPNGPLLYGGDDQAGRGDVA